MTYIWYIISLGDFFS